MCLVKFNLKGCNHLFQGSNHRGRNLGNINVTLIDGATNVSVSVFNVLFSSPNELKNQSGNVHNSRLINGGGKKREKQTETV